MDVADKELPGTWVTADDIKDLVSGNWHVAKGNAAEFVRRWTDFLEWSRDFRRGLSGPFLIQDVDDPDDYLSVGYWKSAEARSAWQSNPTFAEKLGACRALCDDFSSGTYQLTVAVGSGSGPRRGTPARWPGAAAGGSAAALARVCYKCINKVAIAMRSGDANRTSLELDPKIELRAWFASGRSADAQRKLEGRRAPHRYRD